MSSEEMIPKKAGNGYFLFQQAHSKYIIDTFNLKPIDCKRILSNYWSERIPSRAKDYYKMKWKEQNQKYKEWEKNNPEKAQEIAEMKKEKNSIKEKKKKVSELEGAPKKPLSDYVLFCSDHRDGVDKKDQMKILGKMWKNASPETKEKYKKLHQENVRKYEAKLQEFYSNYANESKKKKIKVESKEESANESEEKSE